MWEYGFDGELYLQGLHYLDVAHRNIAIGLSLIQLQQKLQSRVVKIDIDESQSQQISRTEKQISV